jgi:3D (Asp-Asp-Asp) domain-containing protein
MTKQIPVHNYKREINHQWIISLTLIICLIFTTFFLRWTNNRINELAEEVKTVKVEQKEVKQVMLSDENVIEARITCYAPTGNLTASGKVPKNGMIAVSNRTIQFGTQIIIDGITYIVEDRTNKRFENFSLMTVDIFWEDSLESCLDFGVQYKNIIIK